jgi:hypothetical protein
MTNRLWSTLFFATFIGLCPVDAMADDDELDFELDMDEDEEEEPPPERLEGADADDVDEGDPDEEAIVAPPPPASGGEDPLKAGSGLLNPGDDEEDEEESATSPLGQLGPGEDSANIYRAKLAELEGMSADDEAMAWEEYLGQYSATVFRKAIEERQEQLADALYGGVTGATVDAGRAELHFAQGMLLEPIDPQTRLRAGFAWGFPNWINLLVDYEKQLNRDMSVHGGMQRRPSGWNLEGGVRYAIIKDTRTNFILTAIGDVHMVVNPTAPALRPQIAAGKRLSVGSGHLDIQAQIGPDLMLYSEEFSPRLAGGLNITLSPSDTVEAFLETHTYMKDMGWEEGNPFRFNQISFGMRFVGKKAPVTGSHYSAGAGAAVPYSVNYWKYHYGAVMGDFNYYL